MASGGLDELEQLVVDGQMYGGIAQSLGLALSEDCDEIDQHSTMLGAGIPYAKDIPDKFDIYYFANPRENGSFGAAGEGVGRAEGTHREESQRVTHFSVLVRTISINSCRVIERR